MAAFLSNMFLNFLTTIQLNVLLHSIQIPRSLKFACNFSTWTRLVVVPLQFTSMASRCLVLRRVNSLLSNLTLASFQILQLFSLKKWGICAPMKNIRLTFLQRPCGTCAVTTPWTGASRPQPSGRRPRPTTCPMCSTRPPSSTSLHSIRTNSTCGSRQVDMAFMFSLED